MLPNQQHYLESIWKTQHTHYNYNITTNPTQVFSVLTSLQIISSNNEYKIMSIDHLVNHSRLWNQRAFLKTWNIHMYTLFNNIDGINMSLAPRYHRCRWRTTGLQTQWASSLEMHPPLWADSYIHAEELIFRHWQETNTAIFTLT